MTSFNELLHSDVKEILGDVDDLGKLHGDVEIFYENGDYLWADFIHGVKTGPEGRVPLVQLPGVPDREGEGTNHSVFTCSDAAHCKREKWNQPVCRQLL